ncbi:hypothetical protein JZ751_000150 [Albula glossodonta]|uniref:Pre-B-cell leukemia transcription factor-interacting protein 1 n=1 Tax=Albula glossodonta TaxID=121402 RepID=A0A8T2PUZ2_9TELE|nr:hypothetical protein JZ751_000150 [Albula glossodonta]
MSDNSNSNGFASSWTDLMPKEAAVENIGPGVDGNESLSKTQDLHEDVTGSDTMVEAGTAKDSEATAEGTVSAEGLEIAPVPPEAPVHIIGRGDDGSVSLTEAPALSEEVPGPVTKTQTGDSGSAAEIALSEEGLQVCQETAPVITEGSASSSPTVLSPSPTSHIPLISDQEGYTPLNLDTDAYTVTSPYPDADNLNPVSTDPDIYTHTSPAPETIAAESPASDADMHISPPPESLSAVSHAPDADTPISPSPESLSAVSPTSDAHDMLDISPEPETKTPDISALGADAHISPAPEPHYPETTVPTPTSEEGEEPQQEEEVLCEPAKVVTDAIPQEDSFTHWAAEVAKAAEEDGLRRRHVPPPAAPEPPRRYEEEDEDEEEFHLVQRKEESWLSLNKCIVGALVLLILGSILFTEDDSEVSQPGDPNLHGKQEWLNPDVKPPTPKEVSQLLGKLAEENQQMTLLQAQLQSQKEEIDLVLQKAEVLRKEPPAGQMENLSSVAAGLWDNQNEKASEESGTQQEGAKTEGSPGVGAREGMEKSRTEGVEKLQGRGGEREGRRDGYREKEGKKGRVEVKDWKQKEERKEKKVEGDWKYGKDRGKAQHREWKEKVEKRRAWEKGRQWSKDGERKRDGAWKDQRDNRWRAEKKEKDWKAQKDGWKLQRERSDRREERGRGQEKGRKERPWQGSADKKVDYWKHQRDKLQHNRPPVDCRGTVECARKEGLVPVKLAEFQGLLGAYLSKLGGGADESKAAISALVGEFFDDGLFTHHRIPFREFVEDVADMLEDVVEGDRRAEEEMEEFEREALNMFAMAGEGEREGRKRGKDSRIWG